MYKKDNNFEYYINFKHEISMIHANLYNLQFLLSYYFLNHKHWSMGTWFGQIFAPAIQYLFYVKS